MPRHDRLVDASECVAADGLHVGIPVALQHQILGLDRRLCVVVGGRCLPEDQVRELIRMRERKCDRSRT
jgi:hypothetical protein